MNLSFNSESNPLGGRPACPDCGCPALTLEETQQAPSLEGWKVMRLNSGISCVEHGHFGIGADGKLTRYESSGSTSSNAVMILPAPIEREVVAVLPKALAVRCGNLEITVPAPGMLFGSIKMDGMEMSHVTSVSLTWDVRTQQLWRCEIGHIVDERVTGKKKAEANEQETWRDREPML